MFLVFVSKNEINKKYLNFCLKTRDWKKYILVLSVQEQPKNFILKKSCENCLNLDFRSRLEARDYKKEITLQNWFIFTLFKNKYAPSISFIFSFMIKISLCSSVWPVQHLLLGSLPRHHAKLFPHRQ